MVRAMDDPRSARKRCACLGQGALRGLSPVSGFRCPSPGGDRGGETPCRLLGSAFHVRIDPRGHLDEGIDVHSFRAAARSPVVCRALFPISKTPMRYAKTGLFYTIDCPEPQPVKKSRNFPPDFGLRQPAIFLSLFLDWRENFHRNRPLTTPTNGRYGDSSLEQVVVLGRWGLERDGPRPG